MKCPGCFPRSEWWWFKYYLAALPLFGIGLYLWAYG